MPPFLSESGVPDCYNLQPLNNDSRQISANPLHLLSESDPLHLRLDSDDSFHDPDDLEPSQNPNSNQPSGNRKRSSLPNDFDDDFLDEGKPKKKKKFMSIAEALVEKERLKGERLERQWNERAKLAADKLETQRMHYQYMQTQAEIQLEETRMRRLAMEKQLNSKNDDWLD